MLIFLKMYPSINYFPVMYTKCLGCKGNNNNFVSMAECDKNCGDGNVVKPIDPCLEDKVVGPCKGLIKKFYFDQQEAKCKEFHFGGKGSCKLKVLFKWPT